MNGKGIVGMPMKTKIAALIMLVCGLFMADMYLYLGYQRSCHWVASGWRPCDFEDVFLIFGFLSLYLVLFSSSLVMTMRKWAWWGCVLLLPILATFTLLVGVLDFEILLYMSERWMPRHFPFEFPMETAVYVLIFSLLILSLVLLFSGRKQLRAFPVSNCREFLHHWVRRPESYAIFLAVGLFISLMVSVFIPLKGTPVP